MYVEVNYEYELPINAPFIILLERASLSFLLLALYHSGESVMKYIERNAYYVAASRLNSDV